MQMWPLYVFDECESNFSFAKKWQYTASDNVYWSSHSNNLVQENRLVGFSGWRVARYIHSHPLRISAVHAGINQVKSLKPSFRQGSKGASTTRSTPMSQMLAQPTTPQM
jgi:hypothetical protein